MLDVLDKLGLVTFWLVEELLYPINQQVFLVLFHIESLFESPLFILEFVEIVLGRLDSPDQVPGFVSDFHKVTLEWVVFAFKFLDLFVQKLYLLEQLILPILKIFLMGIVTDVFGQQLLNILLLVQNNLIFVN